MDFDGLRFVIARYGEDINWVPPLLKRFPGSKCTVYNKGSTEVPMDESYEVLHLDNVGRESHTYLHHMIENYESDEDTGDEITVFLQGHPFDHCTGSTLYDSIYRGVVDIMKGSSFENIGTQIIRIEDGIPKFHMAIKDELQKTCTDLMSTCLPKEFEFSAGALFMTPRSSISKRDLCFYHKARDMLSHEVNPVRGFCFERLWSLIFI